jgi:hypothetical protein
MKYLADIHDIMADETLNWCIPKSVRLGGTIIDISPFLQFMFWE